MKSWTQDVVISCWTSMAKIRAEIARFLPGAVWGCLWVAFVGWLSLGTVCLRLSWVLMLHSCEYIKEVLGVTMTNFRWSHFRFPNSELIKLRSVSWVVFKVCEESRWIFVSTTTTWVIKNGTPSSCCSPQAWKQLLVRVTVGAMAVNVTLPSCWGKNLGCPTELQASWAGWVGKHSWNQHFQRDIAYQHQWTARVNNSALLWLVGWCFGWRVDDWGADSIQ